MKFYKGDGTTITLSQTVGADNEQELEGLLEDRVLIWHDEFTGTKLDPLKWDSLFGFYGDRYFMYPDSSKNAYVENSILHLTNLRNYPNDSVDWSGAFIHTNNRFEFRYGRLEAKIKFPNNPEYHSTLWMMGANHERISHIETISDESVGVPWTKCGEIDVAECDDMRVTAAVHWENASGGHGSASGASYGVTAYDWHIYALEWTESTLTFYVDGVKKGTFNVENATVGDYNPFRLPHYIMFNQNPYLYGNEAGQPSNFLETQIDWIRVYAPVGAEKVEETAIGLDVEDVTLAIGDTKILTCTFTPESTSDMTLLWETYDDSIVTCYGGKLTALKAGTTYVKCRSKNGYTAYCKVTVTQ